VANKNANYNQDRGAMMKKLWIAAYLAMIAQPTLACSANDIQINQLDWRLTTNSAGTFAKIVGEVTNNCPLASDVDLHLVFRDGAGKVVETADRPVAGCNIPPHTSFGFSTVASVPEGSDVKSLDTLVRPHQWESRDECYLNRETR
jgi:hypothetical protein